MYTARQWLILEILCGLSVVSFIACVTATYYNPDILNKGLWVLLLFAILCNLYIGNALERVCRDTRKLEKAQRAATPPWAEAEVGGG